MLTRRQPVAERGGQRLVVADAAAHLDVDVERADDLGLELAVGAAAEGGVEVDEVQPLGAGVLPAPGRGDRVAVDALGAGDALGELDGAALGDVDGGQQLEVGRVTGCLPAQEVQDDGGGEQAEQRARRARAAQSSEASQTSRLTANTQRQHQRRRSAGAGAASDAALAPAGVAAASR